MRRGRLRLHTVEPSGALLPGQPKAAVPTYIRTYRQCAGGDTLRHHSPGQTFGVIARAWLLW
jgi:hypothetical protein